MRVGVYYSNSDVRVEDVPVPEIKDGEILVRIEASGICGSDVMEWYRVKKAPVVLGHEIAGTVEKVGRGVEGFRQGDRVTVSHHVPCNTCYYCLRGEHSVCDTLRSTNFDPGGFAEYVRVPAINVDRGVFLLPEGMSFEEGSFTEPLGCVVRGFRKVGWEPGWSILVVGSGISGLLHIKLARTLGAGRIVAVDINEFRIDTARRFGADMAVHARDFDPSMIRSINSGRLADLVVLCTAHDSAIEQAVRSVERGGTILFFAPKEPGVRVSLPLFELWRDNVTMVSTYASCPLDTMTAIELIHSRRVVVEDMITHRLGLGEIQKGFDLVCSAEESIKVIIEPQR